MLLTRLLRHRGAVRRRVGETRAGWDDATLSKEDGSMASIVERGRVDRRTLLVGGASFAVGRMFLGAGAAAASTGDTWTPALVTGEASGHALVVTSLDTHRRVQVGLGPGTIVHSDLSAGSQILIQGDSGRDGSIAAQRVIRGVFGERSDVQR
jgi:hypothetical protein